MATATTLKFLKNALRSGLLDPPSIRSLIIKEDLGPLLEISTRFNTWSLHDGTVWTEFYRNVEGYVLRFPKLADFYFDTRRYQIYYCTYLECDTSTLEHLYLNQVKPLIESMQGSLVLHASAVDISGETVLFTGLSGRGKSTLGTYLASHGFSLVSDDSVAFKNAEQDYEITSGHHSVRLWEDSLKALLDGEEAAQRSWAVYSRKTRVLRPEDIPFTSAPGPVSAIFHLAPPGKEGVVCERLNAKTAFSECLPHLFMLDDQDKSVLISHFKQLSAVCSGIPQYRLVYPRQFEALPDVKDMITRTLYADHPKDSA